MKEKRAIMLLTAALFIGISIFSTVLAVEENDKVKKCIVFSQNGNGTDMEAYYEYVINNDGPKTCTIVGYKGDFYSNIMPETLNGYTITRIGDGAFKNVNRITGGFALPSTLISIGNEAFYGCTLITSISLSSTTKIIGDKAFENCTALMKINLENVETIGNEAFKGCTGIKGIQSFTFANKIQSIGSKAFEKCNVSQLVFTSSHAPQIQRDTFSGYEGRVIIPEEDSEYIGEGWTGSYVQGVTTLGDLDNNNVVDANDASLVLEFFKTESATREAIKIADLDRNGVLDANDASLILEIYKTNK